MRDLTFLQQSCGIGFTIFEQATDTIVRVSAESEGSGIMLVCFDVLLMQFGRWQVNVIPVSQAAVFSHATLRSLIACVRGS
jgi:hypothetical protein